MDQNANKVFPNAGNPGSVDIRTQQNQRQEEEADLREIISLLLNHAWVIALAALAGVLLVGLYVKIFVPARYTAQSTIYVFSIESDPSTQTITTADIPNYVHENLSDDVWCGTELPEEVLNEIFQ